MKDFWKNMEKENEGLEFMGDQELLQPQRRQSNSILQAIPTTVNRSHPFLDRLQFELSHWRNSAGNIQQGQVTLEVRPVRFGLSMGRLHLDRLSSDLFVVSPRVDVNGVVGRTNLFGSLGFAIAPQTSEVRTSVFQEGEFGLTYDLIAERRRNGYFLRIGADIAGVGEGQYPFVPSNQGYVHTGIGIAAGLGPLTIYTTARASIFPDTPIEQEWHSVLRLHPLEATGGIVVNLNPAIISAEYLQGNERQRGTLTVQLPTIPLSPEIRLAYSHNQMPFFGDLDQFTAGVTLNLDAPRGIRRVTFRAEERVATTGDTSTPAERNPRQDRYGIRMLYGQELGLVPQVLHRLGRISSAEAQRSSRLIEDLPEENNNENNEFGRRYDEYLISQAIRAIRGLPILTLPEADPLLFQALGENYHYPYSTIDTFIINFIANMAGSETFSEFVQRYAGRSPNELITIAATLASLGNRYYNHELSDASPFGARDEVSTLDPTTIYQGFRQLFRTGHMNAGICANINGFAAEFLRRSGLEAYAVSIGAGPEMHVIALARDTRTNTNYIVDYGNTYRNQGQSFLPLLQSYATARRIIILGIDLFGENNQHMGHYQTPEGALTEYMTTGRERGTRLRGALIRRRTQE